MDFNLFPAWEVTAWMSATLLTFLVPLWPAWHEWRHPTDAQPLELEGQGEGDLLPRVGESAFFGQRVLRCQGKSLPPLLRASERIELAEGSRFRQLQAPTIAAIAKSGAIGCERVPSPPVPTTPPALPTQHHRHFGSLHLKAHSTTRADLVVTGDFSMGEGALLIGHVKVHGDARLGVGAALHGALFSEGSVLCQGGNCLSGPIAAGHRVFLGEGSTAGSMQQPSSVTGWEVLLQPGVSVHGDIAAVERGEVVPVRSPRFMFRLPPWVRKLIGGLLLVLIGTPVSAAEEPPAFQAFHTGDGAYMTTFDSGIVDPYFVNKSFVILLEANANVRAPLNEWLDWLLPRMRADGGFDRFCRDQAQRWYACKPADADDATAASVIEMISLAKKKRWIPQRMRASTQIAVRASQGMLTRLRNPASGLYRVFEDKEIYYLMDNAEIYSALRANGDQVEADKLLKAMHQGFRQEGVWQPALPKYDRESFYPHGLARSYLWNNGVLSTAEAGADMAGWMSLYGDRWRRRADDNFAWGLVAWGLHRLAPIEAACWRRSVRPFSPDIGWTVLDAAADAALEKRGIGTQCPR
jgi:hypothetical protein